MTKGTKPMSLTQRKHLGLAVELHGRIDAAFQEIGIPDAWHDIWRLQAEVHEDREKVEMLFDKDVMRFFRAMGPGHDVRMNQVLRAFMYDRLAGLVKGPEDQVLPTQADELETLQADLKKLEHGDD